MSTLTKRPIGARAASNSSATYTDSASNNYSESNAPDRDERNKDDEHDSDGDKETRLTLMEEVLLLGLKDREVCLFEYQEIFQFDLCRVTHRFGTIVFRRVYVVVS